MNTPTLARMATNSAIALVGKAGARAFGLGSLLLLTWLFLVEGYGRYSFALTYVGIFAAFGEAGLSAILTREFARNTRSPGAVLATGLAIAALVSTLTWGLALLVRGALPVGTVGGYAQDLILIYSFSLLAGWGMVFDALFRARLLMIVPVVVNLARYAIFFAVLLGMALLPAATRPGLRSVVAVWLGLAWAGALIYAGVGFSLVRPQWRPDRLLARDLLFAAVPLWLARMAIVTYYWVDTFMLGTLLPGDPQAVGLYQAARKFPEALALIPAALLDSLYPVFSQLAAQNRARLRDAAARAWVLLLWLALPAAVLGCAWAETLFLVLPAAFRGERSVVGPFQLLMWAEVFVFLNMLCYAVLNAADRQQDNLRVTTVMMLLNVALNVPLILHFAERGASAATLLTELVGLGLELVCVSRLLGRWFPWRASGRVLVCNGLLALVSVALVAWGPRAVWIDAGCVLVLSLGYVWLGRVTGCLEPRIWREVWSRRDWRQSVSGRGTDDPMP